MCKHTFFYTHELFCCSDQRLWGSATEAHITETAAGFDKQTTCWERYKIGAT